MCFLEDSYDRMYWLLVFEISFFQTERQLCLFLIYKPAKVFLYFKVC